MERKNERYTIQELVGIFQEAEGSTLAEIAKSYQRTEKGIADIFRNEKMTEAEYDKQYGPKSGRGTMAPWRMVQQASKLVRTAKQYGFLLIPR